MLLKNKGILSHACYTKYITEIPDEEELLYQKGSKYGKQTLKKVVGPLSGCPFLVRKSIKAILPQFESINHPS